MSLSARQVTTDWSQDFQILTKDSSLHCEGPYWFWDWLTSIFNFIFNFKPVIFIQTLRLTFICVVLYIFSEAIASECSTSHMAPHIYWFPWMRTGSRHGPWNSLPLYLGETIGVSASLDSAIGTGFYKLLSVFAILYTLRMSTFYMPTLINHRNNSKTAPISLYFDRVSSWGSLPQRFLAW